MGLLSVELAQVTRRGAALSDITLVAGGADPCRVRRPVYDASQGHAVLGWPTASSSRYSLAWLLAITLRCARSRWGEELEPSARQSGA